MRRVWTIVYREGDLVGAKTANSPEAALAAACRMREQGQAILAIRNDGKALDLTEVERLVGPVERV
jgi:hypothetical protein